MKAIREWLASWRETRRVLRDLKAAGIDPLELSRDGYYVEAKSQSGKEVRWRAVDISDPHDCTKYSVEMNTHNPWSFQCRKRIWGEPFETDAACAVCEPHRFRG